MAKETCDFHHSTTLYCLAQKHGTITLPGLEYGKFDLESNALGIAIVCAFHISLHLWHVLFMHVYYILFLNYLSYQF